MKHFFPDIYHVHTLLFLLYKLSIIIIVITNIIIQTVYCSVSCQSMNWQLSVLEQRDTSALRVAEWIRPSLFLEKQVIPTFINRVANYIKL